MGVVRTDPTTNKCPEPEMYKCAGGDDNTEGHSTCIKPDLEKKEALTAKEYEKHMFDNCPLTDIVWVAQEYKGKKDEFTIFEFESFNE